MIDINELRRLALGGDLAAMQEIIHRLEAVEKSDAESIAMYRKARDERDALRLAVRHEADCVDAAKAEIEALRAKVEAMEQQEPVASVWRCDNNHIHGSCEQTLPMGAKLYALPGAQNVPTALLVAVADLIAQMEIVSRVGFVDTPNDKDSCAAFCVAEGTWLELMSAVESLASALAAAPEAKP